MGHCSWPLPLRQDSIVYAGIGASELEVPSDRGKKGEQAHLVGLDIQCSLSQISLVAEVDEVWILPVVEVVNREDPLALAVAPIFGSGVVCGPKISPVVSRHSETIPWTVYIE